VVRLPWPARSAPDDKVPAAEAAEIEVVEAEVVPQPLARVPQAADAYARQRLRGEGPPDVKGPTLFLQRMDFETELLATINQVKTIFVQWAYTYAYKWETYYWAYYVGDYFLRILSSQGGGVKPTLFERWRARELSVPFFERPMEMLEMALAEAHRLGLTLRKGRPVEAPLPREKMLKLIDPERRIENPETIGVLQLAADLAEFARDRVDCFVLIDVSPHIRQFGAGKTQLLIQLVAETNAQLGHVFDVRHDIVYGEDHKRFRHLLNDTDPEHAFGVDELDQFAYSREAMKGANKETVQTLKQTRKWGRPVIGCSASLWQLDPFLRDVKITHRVRIEEWDRKARRGRAVVFEKGGFPEPPNDKWGRYPPVRAFEFEGLGPASYALTIECALLARRTGDMDKYLREHPTWPESYAKAELKAGNEAITGLST